MHDDVGRDEEKRFLCRISVGIPSQDPGMLSQDVLPRSRDALPGPPPGSRDALPGSTPQIPGCSPRMSPRRPGMPSQDPLPLRISPDLPRDPFLDPGIPIQDHPQDPFPKITGCSPSTPFQNPGPPHCSKKRIFDLAGIIGVGSPARLRHFAWRSPQQEHPDSYSARCNSKSVYMRLRLLGGSAMWERAGVLKI